MAKASGQGEGQGERKSRRPGSRGAVLILTTALALCLTAPVRAQYGPDPIIPGGDNREPEKKPYSPEDSDPQPKKREDKTCPAIAVLSDANRSTIFNGQGKDVTDILYQAHLSDPVLDCRHKSGNRLNLGVKAAVGVELGLASKSREIEIPYFIAVIDPEQMVVTKEKGTVTVKVEAGSRIATVVLESPVLKLALEEDTIGADLEVLVGLQLNKDQLDYNRMTQ